VTEGGQWVAVRHGCLLSLRVVMALCRGKRLAAMRQGVVQGRLQLPVGQRQQAGETLRNQVGRTKWNVPMRARYLDGQGVVVYRARYLRGGPTAQRRLRACDGEPVVFGSEERTTGPGGQATRRTRRLLLGQCLGRWRLQVPPPGAVRGRGGGR